MAIPKPYYRVKIGNRSEMPIFVSDATQFAMDLRAMLNGSESLRGLADDVVIIYYRPGDETARETSVGQARRATSA
jgi:hypothetical protein